jgi:methylenetetrahydrofolate reductase (NADPH)
VLALSQHRLPGCPKRMVYGPCGGVRRNGDCEMVAEPCVFERLAEAPGQRVDEARDAGLAPRLDWPSGWQAPLVLTDLSVPPADAETLRSTASLLAPSCDAVLVGDHQDRADFPPSTLARLIADAGAVPWVTLACRDRTEVTLQQELAALALDRLATVLCVTGDGRAYDVRPEATQVFDLDGTRLAARAASLQLPVAVVESPRARPVALRPERLVRKQQFGAQVAVLNHVPGAAHVAEFLHAAQQAGLRIPVIASVVVFTDQRSAAALVGLPGLEVDPARVEAVLSADDPVEAGIAAAVEEADQLLRLPGVGGVNLSGLASARSVRAAAEIQADVGHRIRAAQEARA